MTTKNSKKTIVYTCVVIPVAVANGIIGGVSSVITAYLFKPVWDRFITFWSKANKNT